MSHVSLTQAAKVGEKTLLFSFTHPKNKESQYLSLLNIMHIFSPFFALNEKRGAVKRPEDITLSESDGSFFTVQLCIGKE